MMNPEVEQKYKDVQNVLEEALQKTDSIQVAGKEENAQLQQIRESLGALNTEFKAEIIKLKDSSEWDKFCIAFFGETNAGKSTIIDSLRIMYLEETRREAALERKEHYYSQLLEHVELYKKVVASLGQMNDTLKKQYGRNFRWLFYILSAVAGVGVGLLLAHLGIVL